MSIGSVSGHQFAGSEIHFGHATPSIGEGNFTQGHTTGLAHPHYGGQRSLLSYRSDTNSSFGRATAWSVPRGDGTPMSFSKKTAGSVFKFDD
jgi:hypothetical protein